MSFEDEFEILREKYYSAHSKDDKQKLRIEFEHLYKNNYEDSLSSLRVQQLRSWNPFDISKPSTFFDAKKMFNIDNFDIVIANPPYNAKLTNEEIKYYKKKYASVKSGRVDTAALFVELAANVVKSKFIIMYILPYRLITRERNHRAFIDYLLNKMGIDRIIYFGKDAGFEHVNDEIMIMGMIKFDASQNVKICNRANIKDLSLINYEKTLQEKFINLNTININLSRYDSNIINKIQKDKNLLSFYCEVKDGIVPYIREKLISETKKDNRYVRFAGISGTYKLDSYFFESQDLYLCYDINEAKKYIEDPVELRKVQLRDSSIFSRKEKIITAQNSSTIKGTMDRKSIFFSNSIHTTYIKEKFQNVIDLRIILAYMNSNVINYYHDSIRLKGKDLHPQILVGNLRKLPLPNLENLKSNIKKEIIDLVELLISLDKDDSQTIELNRNRLEKVIFDTYSLDEKEIAVIKKYFDN